MAQEYIALPFPDYQVYMEEDWFPDKTYYDSDKDVYLIPKQYFYI